MAKILNTSSLTSKYSLPDSTKKEFTVMSNESSTENMTTSFLKERTTDKQYAAPNEEVLQTIKLTNNSEYQIFDITITDVISNSGKFKPGSVKIDNILKESADITTGLKLEKPLEPTESTTITYTLIVNENPVTDIINVLSRINYSVNETENLTEQTGITEINILQNLITIKKTSNKSVVIKGDILTFQNVVKNEGQFVNTDVFFKDELPNGTSFVAGSVKIDDEEKINLDPSVGFNLKDLNLNDEITITFNVEIK